MGLLKKKYEEAIKKSKGGLGTKYSGFTPYFKTGIDIFDYINGSRREDNSLALGIQGGKIIMDVGTSGSGKTSKIIKMACGIADLYEESDVWHYDYERSTSKERVMNITGWSSEHYEEKYQLFQKDISAETLFRACKEIEKIKKENYDDIKIDSGHVDNDGNPIYYLPPTVIIVDSVALLAPEDVEEDDDLKGSMGAAAIAKSNTNIFKRIMNPIESANIILMLVNHLTSKIELTPVKTQAQVNYLGQSDSIPGGRAIVYLTDTLTKLVTGSKLTPDKELGIKGFYLEGILIKSRNTEAGTRFKMVFEQKYGINNLLTNFVNLKDMGRITGAGRSFKLDTCPDVKFSLKEFSEKYYNNASLRKAFDKAVVEEYTKLIPDIGNEYINSKSNEEIEDEVEDDDENTMILYDDENEVYQDTSTGKFYVIEDDEYVEVEYE
jgi:hypothetical protein